MGISTLDLIPESVDFTSGCSTVLNDVMKSHNASFSNQWAVHPEVLSYPFVRMISVNEKNVDLAFSDLVSESVERLWVMRISADNTDLLAVPRT
jgi:hypothetical protein